MQSATLPLLLLSMAATCAHADCVASRSESRPHLIELYTSEGCSSCPPADDWLRGLPADAGIVALAYHVDYWDYLGWRDRFADPRYSRRQQAQAVRDGSTGVYTPQVVLDGHAWSGWYRGSAALTRTAVDAGVDVSMRLNVPVETTLSAGAPVRIHLDTSISRAGDPGNYRNYVALTEDGLTSQVRAGENRGALLHHDHVVRSFAGPLPLATEAEMALPSDLDIAHASLVAFAQRTSDGAIAQVVALPLAQCR